VDDELRQPLLADEYDDSPDELTSNNANDVEQGTARIVAV
jgi:hypothetical protein